MKNFYALFTLLGTIIPLSQFLPWIYQHGPDVPLFLSEAFQPNIAAFAWLDVIIAAVVLLLFIVVEGSRLGMRTLWPPILCTCLIGVSSGLPLFLWMRESHRQTMGESGSS